MDRTWDEPWWVRLQRRVSLWAETRHQLRLARLELYDPAVLQIFMCGHCAQCEELREYRAKEGRRYW